MKRLARRAEAGMSLIELMVAIALGIFLTFGVIVIFVLSNRAYGDVQRESRMGDNGRFAMQLLTRELRHAGLIGGGANLFSIELDTNLGSINTGDCTGAASALMFQPDAGSSEPPPGWTSVQADANGDAFGCITDAMPGSTVLVIKSVRPVPSDTAPTGSNYFILSNHLTGTLFNASTTQPGMIPQGRYWEYNWHAYYVRNQGAGVSPTLSRKRLVRSGTNNTVTTEDLVDGIEDLHIVQADANNRRSVQVYTLVRSATPEPGNVVSGAARTYTLGDRSRSFAVADNDAFRRVVLNATVAIRNNNF